ncbi:AAA family ATPase [Microbacterium sp. PMB16]|uniref:helix-turn-helix transcriptional regulator n=1 Tax=Microbacterium sp. PMB16 TaxID=3120157 RepID=UPI003F4C874F
MFIGRRDELGRLRAQLDTHRDAVPHVVLVEGPIGIGKTALVSEFLRADLGARVLFARPDELATNIPLAGIRPVIEELLDVDLPILLEENTPRMLQRSIRDALATEPSMLVVDDAHWLDAAALEVLERLIAAPAVSGLSVLLCFRSGTVPDSLLHAAERGGGVLQRIQLGPLEPGDAAALLGGEHPADGTLIALAGGNPLFLRLLAEARLDGADFTDAETAPPVEIGDALRGELSALDPEALAVLHALALTPAIAPRTLREIAGTDAAALSAAAERLARRGFVDADALTIVHPFIRAAAYRSMTARDRHRAHRVAAQHSTDVLERAAHLQHVGSHLTTDEVDTVIRAAVIVSATSPRSSIALLTRTRRIPHRERDLLLARALLLDGRPVEAEELLRDMHAEGTPTGEGLALLLQSLRIQSRPDEAFEIVRDAGAARLEPEVIVELATLAVMHDGDAELDSRTWLDDDDARPGHATALAGLRALSHLRVGDLERGRQAYLVAKAGFETLTASELLPVIDAVTAMGWCAHFLADFADGARLVERAIRLAESRGRFHVLPHLYLILSFLCIPIDRCDEAEEYSELAIAAAEKYNWPDAIPLALTAKVVAAPGRVPAEEFMARYHRLVAAGLPQIGWWRRIVRLFVARASIAVGVAVDPADLAVDRNDIFASQKHIGLGELALAQGDLAAALGHADAAIAWGEDSSHASQAGHGTLFRARVRLAEGRTDEAVADARRAIELFESSGSVLYRRFAEATVAQLIATAAEQVHLETLTRRELDVAELVAEGHTNRTIAELLFLSPRTVESHVARILQKTGIRSRAGIARHLDSRRQKASGA